MTISTYADLKTAVADYLKRRDLDARIPDFIGWAHIKLVETAGPLTPLINDEDTNELLQYNPMAYVFGAVAQAALYSRDTDLLSLYGPLFDSEIKNLAMTGYDTIGGSPQIMP